MKKNTLLSVIVAVGFTASSAVMADTSNQTLAEALCAYTKMNDKNAFRKMMTDNRLRLRNIYSAVVCDGSSLIRFAIQSNSNETAEFLIKQMPSSFIGDSGDIQWTEQNYPSSQVLSILKGRAQGD